MDPISVVFVDDDEVAHMCLSRLLRDLPCRLASFTNPIDCFEKVASQEPQLLIVDTEMPRMNGIELLEKLLLRWSFSNCQIHLCSSIAPNSGIIIRAETIGVHTTSKDLIMNKTWLRTVIDQYK